MYPYFGIRNIPEPIFGKDERDACFSARISITLSIAYIYRLFEPVSLHQHEQSLTFGYLCLSKTQMILDAGLDPAAFDGYFDISALTVADDKERVLFG